VLPSVALAPIGDIGRASCDDLTIDVRALDQREVEVVSDALGLARLYQRDGFYLVAWDGDVPLGHLHLALTEPPELQDVQVGSDHRRRGVARTLIAAAEAEARTRGFARIRVGVSIDNEAAQTLYRTCGYVDGGIEPAHVQGTIQIRTGPLEVDDTIITWEKRLTEADIDTDTDTDADADLGRVREID